MSHVTHLSRLFLTPCHKRMMWHDVSICDVSNVHHTWLVRAWVWHDCTCERAMSSVTHSIVTHTHEQVMYDVMRRVWYDSFARVCDTTHTYRSNRAHVCTLCWRNIYTYVYIYIYIYICMYTNIHILFVYTYIYIYVYMYIHIATGAIGRTCAHHVDETGCFGERGQAVGTGLFGGTWFSLKSISLFMDSSEHVCILFCFFVRDLTCAGVRKISHTCVGVKESCHMWMSHAHMDESSPIWRSHVTFGWVMSHMDQENISHMRMCKRGTGWRRPIGCLISQIFFRILATNYRALWRKMTYKDKGSYDSTPPCIISLSQRDEGPTLICVAVGCIFFLHTFTHFLFF